MIYRARVVRLSRGRELIRARRTLPSRSAQSFGKPLSCTLLSRMLLACALLAASARPVRAFEWPAKRAQELAELSSPVAKVRERALRRLSGEPVARARIHVTRALDDPDPSVQLAAAALASEMGLSEAVPRLTAWLSRWDPKLRASAAEALGRLGDERVVRPLVRALGDQEQQVRLKVVEALGRLPSCKGLEVVPLLGSLNDADAAVRQAVVRVLAQRQDRRAVLPLVGRLSDSSVPVRQAAALALADLGDAGAGPALVRQMRDSEVPAAVAAIEAVGKLRYQPATESLVELLRSGPRGMREAAAATLGQLGNRLALRALTEALGDLAVVAPASRALAAAGPRAVPIIKSLLQEPSTPLRVAVAAVQVAGEARLAAAVPELIDALRQGRLPRLLLIETLGQIADPSAQLVLLELLELPGEEVRLAALRALGSVLDERAAASLLAQLSDVEASERARLLAIGYLGRLRVSSATPALSRLARGKALAPARASVAALGKIPDPAARRVLVALLEHDDRELRVLAVDGLAAQRDQDSVVPLLSLCRRSSGAVRLACFQALGGVLRGRSHEEAYSLFAAAVRGRDRSLLLAAVDALAAMRDSRAGPLLAERCRTLDPPLQRRLMDALGNDPLAAASVRAVLAEALLASDPLVRSSAVWSLGKLADPAARPLLLRAARDSNWMVRVNATAGLARQSAASSPALLESLAADPLSLVRANALLAIGAARNRAAAGLLAERSRGDRCPWVRLNAGRALLALGVTAVPGFEGGPAFPPRRLVEQLRDDDPDPRVRWLAAELLAGGGRNDAGREGDREAAGPATAHRGHPATLRSWVWLRLVDSEGRPLRNHPFVLVTPEGLIKAAVSDPRGEAWEERVGPGQCFVEAVSLELLQPPGGASEN